MTTESTKYKDIKLKFGFGDQFLITCDKSSKAGAKDYKKFVEALNKWDIGKVKKCVQRGIDISKIFSFYFILYSD